MGRFGRLRMHAAFKPPSQQSLALKLFRAPPEQGVRVRNLCIRRTSPATRQGLSECFLPGSRLEGTSKVVCQRQARPKTRPVSSCWECRSHVCLRVLYFPKDRLGDQRQRQRDRESVSVSRSKGVGMSVSERESLQPLLSWKPCVAT